jgi:hypothetical protein
MKFLRGASSAMVLSLLVTGIVSNVTSAASTPKGWFTLPQITCPSTYASGYTPTPNPTTNVEKVPENMVKHLDAYTDAGQILNFVGPKGWHCQGTFDSLGDGGVSLFPGAKMGIEGIVISQRNGTLGTRDSRTCSVFPAAAAWLGKHNHVACQIPIPKGETHVQLGPKVVQFSDPAHVKGLGNLSGGSYRSFGMINVGSTMITCTLPRKLADVCSAVVTNFKKYNVFGPG